MTKSEKKRNEQRGRKKKKPQRDELTNGAPTLEPAMPNLGLGTMPHLGLGTWLTSSRTGNLAYPTSELSESEPVPPQCVVTCTTPEMIPQTRNYVSKNIELSQYCPCSTLPAAKMCHLWLRMWCNPDVLFNQARTANIQVIDQQRKQNKCTSN